ncbi:High-affinity nickel-transporter [Oleispira antarctica RB-8]|jgi:nickel/cobalt exporter|uniref:High-affinity nickel-transporter n=1 Tax=Oleispira antarctica RB-8 TaxID=698738 RepID=R4YJR7_OLEAN|nr:High-affinity nickel-transporter [Oleispira antarctica RB-8]
MTIEMFSLLVTGLGLGLLHALDADHVMAVSALSNRKPSLKRTLKFSANWAIGHGSVLIILGLLFFGLGIALPEAIQQIAESSVGVLLIALGLACFWQFHKEKIVLNKHTHEHSQGSIEHTHLHVTDHVVATENGHEQALESPQQVKEAHTPVMVGILHGLAGSAPALALIPAMMQTSLLEATGYLILFSAGVLFSMVAFGLSFGLVQKKLQQKSIRVFNWSRKVIASAAVGIGFYWLAQAV